MTRVEDKYERFDTVFLGSFHGQTLAGYVRNRNCRAGIAEALHVLENRLDAVSGEKHENHIRLFLVRFCNDVEVFKAVGSILLHSTVLTLEQITEIIAQERENLAALS